MTFQRKLAEETSVPARGQSSRKRFGGRRPVAGVTSPRARARAVDERHRENGARTAKALEDEARIHARRGQHTQRPSHADRSGVDAGGTAHEGRDRLPAVSSARRTSDACEVDLGRCSAEESDLAARRHQHRSTRHGGVREDLRRPGARALREERRQSLRIPRAVPHDEKASSGQREVAAEAEIAPPASTGASFRHASQGWAHRRLTVERDSVILAGGFIPWTCIRSSSG